MGLFRQIEVNIDYILMLVDKYKDSNCKDKDILTTIDKAINSSIELRSKKNLIERSIDKVNASTEADEDWKIFLNDNKEKDIERLIKEENLREKEIRKFIDNAFGDGFIKTTGTDIDRIIPPISRSASNSRTFKKQTIIDKLLAFFEKYFGLV